MYRLTFEKPIRMPQRNALDRKHSSASELYLQIVQFPQLLCLRWELYVFSRINLRWRLSFVVLHHLIPFPAFQSRQLLTSNSLPVHLI